MHVLLNDNILPESEATLKITDLSIQRGYGIFDFLKTVGGKPVFLEDHLDRFYNSAREMRIPVKQSREQLRDLIQELITVNEMPESGVRITLTGGYSPDGFNIAEESNIIVTQQPFKVVEDYDRSVSIITYDYQRQFPTAKTLDYLKAIWLQPVLKEQGADDVLYHNNGLLREMPRANFFMVNAAGEILTPVANILKGVTRKNLLVVANRNFTAKEADITLEDLAQAKEAFITSTTKNILPVTKIDGKILGDGKPGEITTALSKEFNRFVYG